MSMLRNNFTPLLEKTLGAVYQDEFDLYPDVYPQVFNVLSSTKPKETDESVGVNLILTIAACKAVHVTIGIFHHLLFSFFRRWSHSFKFF